MSSTPPSAPSRAQSLAYRAGFVTVIALLLGVVVLLPVALLDLAQESNPAEKDAGYLLTPDIDESHEPDSYSLLHVVVTGISEVDKTMTLRVSGAHLCEMDCTTKEKVTFYSVGVDGTFAQGLPPSESITLPLNAAEFSTRFTLPIDTEIFRYPFDTSTLTLGVAVERVGADNTSAPVPIDEARRSFIMTIHQQIPRMNMAAPERVNPDTVRPERVKNFEYAFVTHLTFSRPRYLQIVVPLIVLLMMVAAGYAVFLRTFYELTAGAGGLILGVYGVRSLVLGSFPSDATLIDLVLTGVVLLFLAVFATRGLGYIREKGAISWFARNAPAAVDDAAETAVPEPASAPSLASSTPPGTPSPVPPGTPYFGGRV